MLTALTTISDQFNNSVKTIRDNAKAIIKATVALGLSFTVISMGRNSSNPLENFRSENAYPSTQTTNLMILASSSYSLQYNYVPAIAMMGLSSMWQPVMSQPFDEYFIESYDFGPNVTTHGYAYQATPDGGTLLLGTIEEDGDVDCLIIKSDADGNPEWGEKFGGSGEDLCRSLAIDAEGNSFILGNSDNTTSNGIDNIVVRYDANGTRLCSTIFGGDATDFGLSIIEGPNRTYYGTGYTSSFGLIQTDVIFFELNINCSLINLKTIGESDREFAWSINVGINSLFTTGSTFSYANSVKSVFLSQLSMDGELLNSVILNGASWQDSYTVLINDVGVLLSGLISTTNGDTNCLLVQLNHFLSLEWSISYGGNSSDICRSVVEINNKIITMGNSNSFGRVDQIFLVAFTSQGDPVWSGVLNATTFLNSEQLWANEINDLLVTGKTYDNKIITVKLDPETGFPTNSSNCSYWEPVTIEAEQIAPNITEVTPTIQDQMANLTIQDWNPTRVNILRRIQRLQHCFFQVPRNTSSSTFSSTVSTRSNTQQSPTTSTLVTSQTQSNQRLTSSPTYSPSFLSSSTPNSASSTHYTNQGVIIDIQISVRTVNNIPVVEEGDTIPLTTSNWPLTINGNFDPSQLRFTVNNLPDGVTIAVDGEEEPNIFTYAQLQGNLLNLVVDSVCQTDYIEADVEASSSETEYNEIFTIRLAETGTCNYNAAQRAGGRNPFGVRLGLV